MFLLLLFYLPIFYIYFLIILNIIIIIKASKSTENPPTSNNVLKKRVQIFTRDNPTALRRNAFAAPARRHSDPIGKRSALLGKLFQIRNVDMTYIYS